MLNTNAEKVLKCIIKKSQGDLYRRIYISCDDFKSKKISGSLICSICAQFSKEGYISHCCPSYDEDGSTSLLITHEGYSYFDNKRTKNFRTWTPIIISLIALIKSFLPELTYLMKSIAQLLKALKGN